MMLYISASESFRSRSAFVVDSLTSYGESQRAPDGQTAKAARCTSSRLMVALSADRGMYGVGAYASCRPAYMVRCWSVVVLLG